MTMANLFSTNVVMDILVSVIYIVNIATNTERLTLQYINYMAATYNMLHTTNKKSQMVHFLIAGHIILLLYYSEILSL